jgi:carboxyl-terminal processing protease
MNRLTKGIVLTVSVMVFCYVAVGFVLDKTNDDRAYRALSVFTEVLQHVQQDYVEDPNVPLVTTGALRGLLESLDPLSSYLSPNEYAEYKQRMEKPAKGEIGAALSKRFGYVVVVSVLPDSPAQRAGLRAGDILESISNFTTREMSVGQGQILLSGEPGTSVAVSVVRRARSEPLELHITRGELAQPKVQAVLLKEPDVPAGSEIGYVRVPSLATGMAAEVRKSVLQLEKQGAKKLVLDLRDCALGPASEGVALAQMFVTSGKIASLRGQTIQPQDFTADSARVIWKHPMNVLISASTSGAAEIAAAAITGTGRGPAVGERTFGSASEQKVLPLEDGAALILTVANYFTPAGKSIPEEGVAPTVEVQRAASDDFADTSDGAELGQPPEYESPVAQDDTVLKRAIELLLSPNSPAQPAKSELRKVTFTMPAMMLWADSFALAS